MAVSGIGVIESGLGGIIPSHVNNFYQLKTTQYQLPIIGPGQGYSSSDEFNTNTIVENHLVGVVRAHTRLDNVTFQGVYTDASNYSGTSFAVTVSGIEAYMGNVYVGHNPQVYAWSGLSNSLTNYLWISLVEQNNANIGYLSSRQFRDLECRSTTANTPPVGPQASVLVATYTSGQGITVLPKGFTLVSDHVNNNINPHGTFLNVNNILTSGVVVMGLNRWNYNAVSGMAPSGVPFSNVTYENQLTVLSGSTLIVSGLSAGLQSGINFSLFNNLTNLTNTAGLGTCGNLLVVSGNNISGANFRNNVNLTSGLSIAGLQFKFIQPQLIDGRQLVSGTYGTGYHFNGTGYISISGVPARDDFTLEAWVRTSDNEGSSAWNWWQGKGIIDGEMPGFVNDFGLTLIGGSAGFGVGNADTTIHSQNVADGQWHHWAATRVNSTGAMNLYIDGILAANTTGPTGSRKATAGLKIGAQNQLAIDPNGVSQFFKGDIDEVRIWNIARDQVSIQNTMSNPLVLPQTGLVAYLKLNDLPGTNPLRDYTGNQWFGTLNSSGIALGQSFPVNAVGAFVPLHSHSLNPESACLVSINPQYPNSVYFPPEQTSFGPGTGNQFEYNFDLGNFKPTLRVKSQLSSNLYIRSYVPIYYNKLDSVNIKYAIDSGSNPILVNIRDCVGNLFTPLQGGILSGVGINVQTVSGIPQAGFAQNMPFDVEFSFNGISGTNQYLGDVIFAFVAQNP